MGTKTSIEWTDSTWGPLRGCSRVSEGCRNCYAERIAARFCGPGRPFEGLAVMHNGKPAWTGKVELVEKHLLDPLKWGHGRPIYDAATRKRIGCDISQSRRIFVNSMSDLFHENVTDEMRDQVFAVMAICPQHVFQVLTKRPRRMLAYLKAHGRTSAVYCAATLIIGGDFSKMPAEMIHHRSSGDGWWPLPNLWLGVSVETQAAADERIPPLLQTPTAVRFISAEPLLGAVEFSDVSRRSDCVQILGKPAMEGIDWVICGGESGPGARPMRPDWARSLRDQCAAAGVPFFFKQWGEWLPGNQYEDRHRAMDPDEAQSRFPCMDFDEEFQRYEDCGGGSMDETGDAATYCVGKKAAGSLLDGIEHKAFPAMRP